MLMTRRKREVGEILGQELMERRGFPQTALASAGVANSLFEEGGIDVAGCAELIEEC